MTPWHVGLSRSRVGMLGRKLRRVSGSQPADSLRFSSSGNPAGRVLRRRFRKLEYYIAVIPRSVFLICAVDVFVTIGSRLQHHRHALAVNSPVMVWSPPLSRWSSPASKCAIHCTRPPWDRPGERVEVTRSLKHFAITYHYPMLIVSRLV